GDEARLLLRCQRGRRRGGSPDRTGRVRRLGRPARGPARRRSGPPRGPSRFRPGRRRLLDRRRRHRAPSLPRPRHRAPGGRRHRARRCAALRAALAEAHVTAPLLALESVRYRHGPSSPEAVAGVSLQVAVGEVVGLIGPNAAGKSTLARIACGLLRPNSGSVRLRGDDAFTLPRRERARRVAFLSQSEPADIAFTAREVALMGRAPHLGLWALEAPGDRALAESALAEVDVLDLADRPVTQLSGGERQRVFLARVFAQDAALLVL